MKNTSIFASAAMILATAAIASANPFSDVPATHWAYQSVNDMAAKGIIQGFPNGTFKGNQNVTRYQLAMIVAKMVANVEQLGGNVSKTDLQTLEKLTVEFADELALLGVKVTALEDDMQVVKEDVAGLKKDVDGIKSYMANGGMQKVRLSGDMLVRHTNAREKGDTNASNNARTSTQLRLQLDAQIDENVKAVARWYMVDDNNFNMGAAGVAGAAWNGSNHKTGDVDVAYLEIKDMFKFGGTFTFGRRFMTHGHALLINDTVDAVSYAKRCGDIDVALNVLYNRQNGEDYRNVWNLNFDTKYRGHDLYLGFYYNSIDNGVADSTNRFDVEFGGKGALGNNGHWAYDLGAVYSKVKDGKLNADATLSDAKGWMLHGAVKWDSKKDFAAKVAYTMIDEESAGARFVSYDERYADGTENPLEDVLRGSVGTGYANPQWGNNVQDLKVQVEYTPKKHDKHYFRFAYDMVQAKDDDTVSMFFTPTVAGAAQSNSDKANVFTFEYRYQLAQNTRLRLGYTEFQFNDGADVNNVLAAPHARDYGMFWTEVYSRF